MEGSRSGIVPVEQSPPVRADAAPSAPMASAAVQAAKATGGAVTVYELDTPGTPGAGDGLRPPVALQSAADPSVDVYPIDYGRADPGARWAGSGILMPSGRDAMAGKVLDDNVQGGPGAFPSDGLSARDGAPARVFFAHGSSTLTPSARKVLADMAAWANRTGGSIVVEGHASRRAGMTDSVGRETVNLKQSLDRAYAVSRELLRLGVTSDRIRTSGLGDSRPSESMAGRSAEAASRRVEIYNEDQKFPASR